MCDAHRYFAILCGSRVLLFYCLSVCLLLATAVAILSTGLLPGSMAYIGDTIVGKTLLNLWGVKIIIKVKNALFSFLHNVIIFFLEIGP